MTLSGDCDDDTYAIFPGAEESCIDADDDCDGQTDEDDASDASTWYADSDGDGFGDSSVSARETPGTLRKSTLGNAPPRP